jgi:hypothetical protein
MKLGPAIRPAAACGLAALVLLFALPAAAQKRGVPTSPGTYSDWNDDIDQVEIVESFAAADYRRLVVVGFDTAATPLPEPDDNTYEPVKQVLADVATPLAQGLREAAEGLTVETSDEPPSEAGVLILRGRVLEMDPGSRAARYWGGFGAGAARTKIEGELVDAASGRVLLRFTQERRSGFGVGGGNYVNLMQRNLVAIGEDVGNGLRRF